MSDLLYCPFCKGTKLQREFDDGISWVKCCSCGATGPVEHKRGDEDDPDWNTRADSAELAAIQEENKRLREVASVAELIVRRPGHEYDQYVAMVSLGGALAALSQSSAHASEPDVSRCPMCHGTGMCDQPVAAPAGVEIPKYPKTRCPMCRGKGFKAATGL